MNKREKLPFIANIAATILGIAAFNQIFRLTPSLGRITYYGIFIFFGFLLLTSAMKEEKIWIYEKIWLLWGIMWLSILFNYSEIPPAYQVVYRNISFFLVMLGVGPFMNSNMLSCARFRVLNVFNFGLFIMVMLSFIGYWMHLFPKDPQGYYIGCSIHSMYLGCISGITMLNCLHEAMITSGRMKKYFLLFGIFSFLTGMLAASRVALGSCIVGVIAYCAICFRGRYSAVLKRMLMVVIICGILINYCDVSIFIDGINKKMRYQGEGINLENLTSSRMEVWEDRINEFKNSPIFGVGAHSTRPEYCSRNQYSELGVVEPGNAWLFFLSSSGIFSFIVFCSIMITSLSLLWRRTTPFSDGALFFSLLCYFTVFMNAEAHITASGDYTFIYFWLLISLTLPRYCDSLCGNQMSLQIFMPRKVIKMLIK